MAQIKKDTSLRKAILQAAITGQLISDIGGESLPLARTSLLTTPSPRGSAPKTPTETGKQLLERIIEERNKKLLAEWEEVLKKNPKAKKPTPIIASEIDEDEIPFEIPENWCWCRLGDVIDVRDGTHDTPSYTLSGYPLITGKDFYNGYFDLSKTQYVSQTDYELIISRSKVDVDDIIFSMIGGNIGSLIHITKENYFDMAIKNVALFKQYNYDLSLAAYLEIFLRSQTTNFKDIAKGGAQTFISLKMLRDCYYPLPPLPVQNAIVAKLEQVLPLVEAYENAVLQKEELKNTLSDKVKKAILQEAITGKLTEQWRKQKALVEPVETTESGEQLLDRIIKERNAKALAEWEEKVKTNPKVKKPVPVVASEIEENEIPFEIPESWCWCRLGDLVPFGQCENAEPNEIEDEAWILDLEDIEKDTGRILQFKNKKEVDSKSTKHVFKKGYVLYSKLRPYLNKCVIAPKDGYCTSEILPLDFGNLINNKFAQIFLMSPYFVDYTDSLSFGVKMPRLGTEDGKKALIPLPPLEEQEEIVKKVEELLTLCK